MSGSGWEWVGAWAGGSGEESRRDLMVGNGRWSGTEWVGVGGREGVSGDAARASDSSLSHPVSVQVSIISVSS